MRIAAIDQGTTSTRVLLLEGGEAPRVLCAHRHTTTHPKPGWVEQDALELLANVRLCLDVAGSVDAVGLDNQGETCLAWDAETGAPVGPAIVWQDARTADRLEAMKADGQEAVVLERAGLPLDPYFSASKLAWILANRPEAAALHQAGRLRLGTTDAFFLQHLTGRCVTDVTTASRTSLMALDTGTWCPELCRLFGVPIETLPEIVSTVGDFGACAQGPVLASVVDQQAALYGHGCRRPGDAKITFGTGAFVLAVTGDAPLRVPDAGLLPTVAWDLGGATSYAVDGGVYNAGSAVEWLQGLGLIKDVAELAAFDRAPAIDRDLVFVPALSGLACPHWDRRAAGMWLGAVAGHRRSRHGPGPARGHRASDRPSRRGDRPRGADRRHRLDRWRPRAQPLFHTVFLPMPWGAPSRCRRSTSRRRTEPRCWPRRGWVSTPAVRPRPRASSPPAVTGRFGAIVLQTPSTAPDRGAAATRRRDGVFSRRAAKSVEPAAPAGRYGPNNNSGNQSDSCGTRTIANVASSSGMK